MIENADHSEGQERQRQRNRLDLKAVILEADWTEVASWN